MTRVSLVVVLLAASVPAWAQGPGTGVCFEVDAREGTSFVAEGMVTAVSPGEGYTVETEEGPVEVHGMGPARFWYDAGVPRPGVGDTIRVEGYRIDCGAGEENLAVTVTVGGETMQLRDAETGLPLWTRGGGRGGGGRGRGGG